MLVNLELLQAALVGYEAQKRKLEDAMTEIRRELNSKGSAAATDKQVPGSSTLV